MGGKGREREGEGKGKGRGRERRVVPRNLGVCIRQRCQILVFTALLLSFYTRAQRIKPLDYSHQSTQNKSKRQQSVADTLLHKLRTRLIIQTRNYDNFAPSCRITNAVKRKPQNTTVSSICLQKINFARAPPGELITLPIPQSNGKAQHRNKYSSYTLVWVASGRSFWGCKLYSQVAYRQLAYGVLLRPIQ